MSQEVTDACEIVAQETAFRARLRAMMKDDEQASPTLVRPSLPSSREEIDAFRDAVCRQLALQDDMTKHTA